MKIKKVVTIVVIMMLIMPTLCFAQVSTELYRPGEPTQSDYKEVFEFGSTIAGALTSVGVVVAVVGLMILGIKYMMGSVSEKADYKKTMIPYLVGCIFLFSISTIVSIIYNLVKQIH